jgi:hypothetical protein
MTGLNGIGSGHFETGSGGHFRGTMHLAFQACRENPLRHGATLYAIARFKALPPIFPVGGSFNYIFWGKRGMHEI